MFKPGDRWGFLVVFLASAYAVWHKAKSSRTQEPSE